MYRSDCFSMWTRSRVCASSRVDRGQQTGTGGPTRSSPGSKILAWFVMAEKSSTVKGKSWRPMLHCPLRLLIGVKTVCGMAVPNM